MLTLTDSEVSAEKSQEANLKEKEEKWKTKYKLDHNGKKYTETDEKV